MKVKSCSYESMSLFSDMFRPLSCRVDAVVSGWVSVALHSLADRQHETVGGNLASALFLLKW